MEDKSYYIYETFTNPQYDGEGRIFTVETEEEAWKKFGEYIWDHYKGSLELCRIYGNMYLLPSGMNQFETEISDIDLKKCKFMSTKSFCVPPHAPRCYATGDRHSWDENLATPLEKSEWEGCLDYSIPCKHCNILKIIRVGEIPINGRSKVTPVRYEPRPMLHGEIMIVSEPKMNLPPKLKDNVRICGVCEIEDEEVHLFHADSDEDAITIAEWIMRGDVMEYMMEYAVRHENFMHDHSEYVKYYLAVAPLGTKIDDEIFASDLLKGEWITEGIAHVPPIDNECAGKDHEWSDESYVISTQQVGTKEQIETDVLKYCKVKTCDSGKMIRVGLFDTHILRFINLCPSDVEFKDNLV